MTSGPRLLLFSLFTFIQADIQPFQDEGDAVTHARVPGIMLA